MGRSETLSRKQRKALAALLLNTTIEQSAKEAGVGVSTLKRWLTQPPFRAELNRLLKEQFELATARLSGDLLAAVGTLAEIHKDTTATDSARVRAASLILEHYTRYSDAHELAERVARLEQLAEEMNE